MTTTKPKVVLVPMTRELYHQFYRSYENDPDIFAENFHEYLYDEEIIFDVEII